MAVTKLLLSTLTVGLAAAIAPRAPAAPPGFCCFSLTAANPLLGEAIIEEDTIGQNRIFGSYPDGYYCFDPASPGRLYDSIGNTCIIYQQSRQFQCTSGIQSPAYFSLAKNGDFLIDGSNNFWACPATGPGHDGSYLIFAEDKPETVGCISISMDSTANACIAAGNATAPASASAPAGVFPSAISGSGVASNSAPAPTDSSISVAKIVPTYKPTSLVVASSVTGPLIPAPSDAKAVPAGASHEAAETDEITETDEVSECPQDLKSDFLAPNLIIPVSPEAPDAAYGTQYSATISPGNSTVFSFDVPSSWTGQCSLLFAFPYAPDTAFPGAFHFSGVEEQEAKDGGLKIDLLKGAVENGLTWDTKPKSQDSYGKTEIIPGNSYTIATVDCQSGQRIAYEVSSVGDVELKYFQSTGPKPIGLWIVKC